MTGPAAKPRAYVCYLCGQQYGSRSLATHITNCKTKWQQREAAKLPRERRQLPVEPACDFSQLPTTASGIDDFNARMFEHYNSVSLCQCQHCGRSFHEEVRRCHAT
jgi:hypothetical protein